MNRAERRRQRGVTPGDEVPRRLLVPKADRRRSNGKTSAGIRRTDDRILIRRARGDGRLW